MATSLHRDSLFPSQVHVSLPAALLRPHMCCPMCTVACAQDRDSIMVTVRTANKGGVLGFFQGLPLFIPWSFLPRRADGFVSSKEV